MVRLSSAQKGKLRPWSPSGRQLFGTLQKALKTARLLAAPVAKHTFRKCLFHGPSTAVHTVSSQQSSLTRNCTTDTDVPSTNWETRPRTWSPSRRDRIFLP